MDEEDIIAILFLIFLIILIFVCLGPNVFYYWSPEYEERLEEYQSEQAKMESLKGECVEYYGHIDGNWIKHGSDGSMYCIKWRNKEDTSKFICEEYDNYYC